jgi:uncharacterized protein YcbX
MWTLEQIWIYPIKSLPGVMVQQSEILPQGNLRHDRELALVDFDGKFVNGKRTATIHQIQAIWNLSDWTVELASVNDPNANRFHLDYDRAVLETWLSEQLGQGVRIEQRPAGGFPDDLEASGPTVISTATLGAVASWFPGLQVDEVRRRFRTNLELSGSEPFSEDRLFGAAHEGIRFTIGTAQLLGTNPCQRCVVPTRSSQSGDVWPLFQKTFAEQRRLTLPEWSDRDRFNHYYRVAINTRTLADGPQTIQIGDQVRIG